MSIRLGIRGKLFLISLAIILIVVLISGAYLERRLRVWLGYRIETELLRQARSVADTLQIASLIDDVDSIDPVADTLGKDLSARVTVVAADGSVLGDSEVDTSLISDLPSHADRPEFVQALTSGAGLSRRYSATLKTQTLYVAVPYGQPEARGVVRVSMPLSEVDQVAGRLRMFILIGALIGVGVAVVIIGLGSHLVSTRVRVLVDHAREIVEGKRKPRLRLPAGDEIGGLAGTLNRLAEEFERVAGEFATERDHLQAVLEGISDGIIALDRGGKVTLVNTAALSLLGLDESPIGGSLLDTLRVPALYDAVSESEGIGPEAVEFDLPGPTPKRVLAHVTSQGAESGRVIVLRDVTEVRELERARRDFFANASHELRTPVGAIQANAETLASGAISDPARAQRFLDAVYRNSKRLSGLIADLLQISRIEDGKFPVVMAPVRAAAMANRALEAVERLAGEKRITLTSEVPKDIYVLADEKALEEVLMNLVDNAVKYTQEEGRVTVRARVSADRVQIEVEDNGPGIPPEHRTRIFERFYRIDPGRSREMGGTGLGLAIVKHLVSAMAGEVKMVPASPKGSIFVVTLQKADRV